METKETEPTKKTDSRKFLVWLIWLLICVVIGVYTFIVKNEALLTKVLEYFFALSMMYLGVNVGQKGVLAIADALKNKYSIEEEEK
jgi:hypothetical protein